jgi:hypothetical protein
MAQKRIIKGWDEEDALTDWRKWYGYTQRAGVCARVKRRYRRRERRTAKISIRRTPDQA